MNAKLLLSIATVLCLVHASSCALVPYETRQCPGSHSSRCLCAMMLNPSFTCPAGSFCQEPNVPIACSPGLFCPENSSQPVFCCEGHYCETPASIRECPSGHYCLAGQVKPFRCAWMETCGEGSVDGEHVGVYVFLGLTLIVAFVIFQFKSYMDRRRSRRRANFLQEYSLRQESEVSPMTTDGAKTDQGGAADSEASSRGSASQDRSSTVPTVFDIRFEELGLTLGNGKTILKGVSGVLRSGRTCCILGPSGAGKTTFLSVLSGKVRKTHGKVIVNDSEEKEGLGTFRSCMGFVPQEDVMIRSDTVQNILSFAAAYRCDASLSHLERKERVAETIKLLGLEYVRESPIGDERKRGISGGQRKRVNIGIEIVADPKILFLDEPTSGLDATASLDVCRVLKNFARRKLVTVAAVIHQPRYEIFASFDDLLLLGRGGRTVYMGPVSDALSYFESLGFYCPPMVNAADFILDVVSGHAQWSHAFPFDPSVLPSLWEEHSARSRKSKDESLEASSSEPVADSALADPSLDKCASPSADPMVAPTDVSIVDVVAASNQSHQPVQNETMTQKLKSLCTDLYCDTRDSISELWFFFVASFRFHGLRQMHNFPYVLYLCLRRTLRSRFHDFWHFLRENILHVLCGMFLGVAAKQLEFVGPLTPQIRAILCPFMLQRFCEFPLEDAYQVIGVFICWGLTFAGIASGVSTFGPEEINYWREVSSGLTTLPYFLAKFLTDLIRMAIAALLFMVSFLSLYETSMNLGLLYGIALMLYFNGFAMGYTITLLFGITMAPLVGIVVALLYSIVLSGFQPSLASIQSGWMWLYDTSYARWGVEGYYDAEITRFDYYPSIDVAYEEYGYVRGRSAECIRNMFFIGMGWTVVAFLLMTIANLSKKR